MDDPLKPYKTIVAVVVLVAGAIVEHAGILPTPVVTVATIIVTAGAVYFKSNPKKVRHLEPGPPPA